MSEPVTQYEFEVTVGDEFAACASSPNRNAALAEAMHYAEQYRSEGEVKVYEVTRKLLAEAPSQDAA